MVQPQYSTSEGVQMNSYLCRACKRTEDAPLLPAGWLILKQSTDRNVLYHNTRRIGLFCCFECLCSYILRRYETGRRGVTVQGDEARLTKMLGEAQHE